ncbi:MAG: four helix bundle protein [Candidatus Marinimicrobia bacterium]|nr:four helix bundle protein [Candidatus Neomarinimicrobiota bacterium]
MAYQLLKASSSVAANYRAVNRAKSIRQLTDKNKIKIVLEESDVRQLTDWLTFIQDIDLIRSDTELEFLINESDEFVAIFTSALKTLNKS